MSLRWPRTHLAFAFSATRASNRRDAKEIHPIDLAAWDTHALYQFLRSKMKILLETGQWEALTKHWVAL